MQLGGSCADSRLAAWRDPKPVIRVREATPAVLSPRARLTKLLTGRAGVGRSVRRERQAPPGRPRRDRQRGPTVQFAVLGIISRRGRGAGRGVTFRSESEDDWVGDAGPPPMENIFLPEIFCHPRPRPSEGGGKAPGGLRAAAAAARGSVGFGGVVFCLSSCWFCGCGVRVVYVGPAKHKSWGYFRARCAS